MNQYHHKATRQYTGLGLLTGILFISLNLRASMVSVSPQLDLLGRTFHLSESLLGLLTTLPLLAFALISNIAPWVTEKWGIGKTLLGALILLTVGIAIRSTGGVLGLYSGTVLLGIAIDFGNVFVPGVIKTKILLKAGWITAITT